MANIIGRWRRPPQREDRRIAHVWSGRVSHPRAVSASGALSALLRLKHPRHKDIRHSSLAANAWNREKQRLTSTSYRESSVANASAYLRITNALTKTIPPMINAAEPTSATHAR